MKTNPLTLLTMGRSLIRLKDRTGAYKLPTGKAFPEFGFSGRRKIVQPSAVRAPASAAQASLFESPKAPVAAVPAPVSAPVIALAQVAPLPSVPPKASSVPVVSSPSYLSRASSAVARFWTKVPRLPSLSGIRPRLPKVFQFHSNSVAHDSRPRAQAELALEKVTVLRNDLSEAGLVVVKVERKKEIAQTSDAAVSSATGNSWTRATARWIKLKPPAAQEKAGATPERPAQMAELRP